jgi:hypothetical protein
MNIDYHTTWWWYDNDHGNIPWICHHNIRRDVCGICSPQYQMNYNIQWNKLPWWNTKDQLISTLWWISPTWTSKEEPKNRWFSHPQTQLFWFLIKQWFLVKDGKDTKKIFMSLDILNNKLKALSISPITQNKEWKIPKTKTISFTRNQWIIEQWTCNVLSKKSDKNDTILYSLQAVFPRKTYKKWLFQKK